MIPSQGSITISGEVKVTIASGACANTGHVCLYFNKVNSAINEDVTSNNYACINVTEDDLKDCSNGTQYNSPK